jgi:glycosyltransferase involved in cell wall biosynthesis
VGGLVNAIKKLLENNELAGEMGDRAYEIAHKKFNKRINLPKIITIYEDLAAKK